MDTLGSEEPDWNCTLKDGSGFLKIEDDDTDKCERIKDCSELIPIVSVENSQSIFGTFHDSNHSGKRILLCSSEISIDL